MWYYLIFNSIHFVFKAEKILKTNAVTYQVYPTPIEVSQSCGVSIRIKNINYKKELICTLFNDLNIPFTVFEKSNYEN